MKMEVKKTFSTKATTAGSTTKVIASTGNPDRYSDIVVWNDSAELDAYMANPVVQFGHNYDTPPIGKTVGLEIDQRTGDLVAEIQWDDSPDNPMAQMVARQFREGYMSAVSVGFQPGESTPRNRLPKDHEAYGERGHLMTSPRLLEISAVPVPANAEALAIRGIDALASDVVDVFDDEDSLTVVFRKVVKGMKDDEEEKRGDHEDDEDMAAHEDDEDMGAHEDDEDMAAHDDEEEKGAHDEDEDEMGYHDDEDEDKAEHEDMPASVSIDAPDGYHWMDYDGGPVLMAGDDADHEGGMSSYPFEVVAEHDPDRMKEQIKAIMADLIANDPSIRMMVRSIKRTKTAPTNALAGLFGIDNL